MAEQKKEHRELIILRNRKIIARYNKLKESKKFDVNYIFETILRYEFYLEVGTLQNIVYNQQEWLPQDNQGKLF